MILFSRLYLEIRYHGSGICEVWIAGHVPEEKQKQREHPVEA